MPQKQVPLTKIKPNPHRRMDRYPVRDDKIAALKESIKKTGYWGNVVGRERNGHVELAYGHHRWITMEKLGKKFMELIIQDLDDEMMFKMMARENMEEWGASAIVEQETVRAAVEAYANGVIHLSVMSKRGTKTEQRYAPSFVKGHVAGANRAHPYSSKSLMSLLGWGKDKVNRRLAELEAIETGDVDASHYDGLGNAGAEAVTTEASRTRKALAPLIVKAKTPVAKKNAERHVKQQVRKVTKAVSKALKAGTGYRDARKVADKVRDRHKPQKPAIPDINVLTEDVAGYIDGLLRGDNCGDELTELLKYKAYIAPKQQKKLEKVLEGLGKRCSKNIATLNTKVVGTKLISQ